MSQILEDVLHLPAPVNHSSATPPEGTLTTIAAREASRTSQSPLRPVVDPLQDLLNRLAIFEYGRSTQAP